MDKNKLAKLICNIRDLHYSGEKLKDVDKFEKQLAVDLKTNQEEALALLGYLVNGNYANIMKYGIVLNPSNKEIRDYINSDPFKPMCC